MNPPGTPCAGARRRERSLCEGFSAACLAGKVTFLEQQLDSTGARVYAVQQAPEEIPPALAAHAIQLTPKAESALAQVRLAPMWSPARNIHQIPLRCHRRSCQQMQRRPSSASQKPAPERSPEGPF